MSKGRFVKKVVPATTNNKTEAIINFLLSEGHSASRVNTTGVYDKDGGFFRKTGGRLGFSDISVAYKSKYLYPQDGKNIAIAGAIECKFTDGDELSDAQDEFLKEIESVGGFSMVVKSLEEFYSNYRILKLYHF